MRILLAVPGIISGAEVADLVTGGLMGAKAWADVYTKVYDEHAESAALQAMPPHITGGAGAAARALGQDVQR